VNGVLTVVVIAACLAAAGWTTGLAATNRRPGNRTLIGFAAVEVLIVVQLLVALLAMAGGERPGSTVTFLAYGIAALAVLPIGVFWSVAEPSRSGTLVITVACLALSVMTFRMLQIWQARSG
jgi:hypothetical protein